MKIVLINNLYGEFARGGAERIVEIEARLLAVAGHAVSVISLQSVSGTRFAGAGYAELGRRPRFLRFLWHVADIFNVASARRMSRLLAGDRPDIVHTHNLMGFGFLVPFAIRRLGIPHVHTLHDVQLLHPSGLLTEASTLAPSSLPQKAYVALMRRLMGSPDVVISPSQFLLDAYFNLGFFPHSRLVVIPNPAPPLDPSPSGSGPGQDSRPLRPSFLFVGQLELHKGIMDLLDVWPGVSEACPGATLEIVGDGLLAEEVRRRSQEMPGVSAFGRLDAAGVAGAMRRAAFIVVPSRIVENAPTVITEAMARGTPVIASRIGGTPELVQEGVNGFLFAPGDSAALADVLGRVCAAMSHWRELSDNAFGIASGRTGDRHLASLLKIFSEIKKTA